MSTYIRDFERLRRRPRVTAVCGCAWYRPRWRLAYLPLWYCLRHALPELEPGPPR